jgi:hypothetical protein
MKTRVLRGDKLTLPFSDLVPLLLALRLEQPRIQGLVLSEIHHKYIGEIGKVMWR